MVEGTFDIPARRPLKSFANEAVEKFRGRAAAWTLAGVAAVAAGVATYKVLKSRQDIPNAAVEHQVYPRTSISTPKRDLQKRKSSDEHNDRQARTIKRSQSNSSHVNDTRRKRGVKRTSVNAHHRSKCPASASSSCPSATNPYTSGSGSSASTQRTSETIGDTDPYARFHAVCGQIDITALEAVALRVRKQKLYSEHDQPQAELLADGMACLFQDVPMSGSYNIVYPLLFSDEVKWLVSIPGHGHILQGLDQVNMDSEYQTMRYVKANTSIPLPEVYYWDLHSSEIGSAFAHIEHLPGRPLSHVWEDVLTRKQRFRTLKGIAMVMAQLQFCHFDKIGMLRFDDEGNPISVDSEISLPNKVGADTPWEGEQKTSGPHSSYQEILDCSWCPVGETAYQGDAGEAVLQMALDSIPEDLLPGQCNTLNKLDVDLQNLLVDQCGSVTGIIDWDGVATRPTSAGCGRYPDWLRRDWDPWYDYDPEERANPYMDPSPEQMIKYRRFYAAAFARCSRGVREYDPRMTHVSHILHAIEHGIQYRYGRPQIVNHLINHAFGRKPNDDPPNVSRDEIKAAFAKMWHAEWEQPEEDYGTDVE